MQKNWSKPVKTGYLRQPNRLGPVLIGSVAVSPKMRNRNRGCGCRLPILGPKNRTELDLQTLVEPIEWDRRHRNASQHGAGCDDRQMGGEECSLRSPKWYRIGRLRWLPQQDHQELGCHLWRIEHQGKKIHIRSQHTWSELRNRSHIFQEHVVS